MDAFTDDTANRFRAEAHCGRMNSPRPAMGRLVGRLVGRENSRRQAMRQREAGRLFSPESPCVTGRMMLGARKHSTPATQRYAGLE